MPVKKKPKKEKAKKPGKLRAAALKAARAAKRATERGSDFLGLTGAAYTPGAWTSATEGNPNSVWNGSVWTNVPTGPKDTRNHGYPSNYTPSAWAQGQSQNYQPGTIRPQGSRFEQALSIIINGQPPTNAQPPYYQAQPGHTGPDRYVQPLTPAFQPATTLAGQIYDIVRGVDPYTGNVQWPYGTPGTLKPGASLGMNAVGYETWLGGGANYRFGGPHGTAESGFGPQLPNTALSPKRFDKRPRWLQWYESIQ